MTVSVDTKAATRRKKSNGSLNTSMRRGMKLHLDGARLANAAAHLGLPLQAFTTDVGVDVLSFGGTKNGLLFGEPISGSTNSPTQA